MRFVTEVAMGGAFLECAGDSFIPHLKQHFYLLELPWAPFYCFKKHQGRRFVDKRSASAATLHALTHLCFSAGQETISSTSEPADGEQPSNV